MPTTPRLFVDAALGETLAIVVSQEQASYLTRVLRLGPGAQALLFNGRDGEWAAEIEHVGKREAILRCRRRTRPQATAPDAWLLFAPVKRQGTDLIVEKATELGVSRICPAITRRTQAEAVRTERLLAIAREAAEQCGRLDVPTIDAARPLEKHLDAWEPGRALAFADEAGNGAALGPSPGRFALLVGPEGGFAPEEREGLRARPFVTPISLGPRILRAETAVTAGLALVMSAWGDWG